MTELPYSASAVKMALWFSEFRSVVCLLHKGTSWNEICRMSEEENYFGNSSPARGVLKLQTIRKRIDAVDPSFIPLFAVSDLPTQRILALAAVMAIDRLLFELVYEVLRDHIIMSQPVFNNKDLERFFDEKKRQNERVGHWTKETLDRLKKTYRGMLAEAGVTGKGRDSREIYPVLMPEETERWMKENRMGAILKALTGER